MATIFTDETLPRASSARGFASMDPATQREIARKGGRSVPAEKRSFSRDPELAAAAGRKGGNSVPAEQRSFSRNRALAARAGRKGGIGSRKARVSNEKEESAVFGPTSIADDIENAKHSSADVGKPELR